MKLINGKVAGTHTPDKKPGIGISNVEKRLSLLYPGKHEFEIISDADVFVVNLKAVLEQRRGQLIKPLPEEQPAYA